MAVALWQRVRAPVKEIRVKNFYTNSERLSVGDGLGLGLKGVIGTVNSVMCGWLYVGVFWQLCGCFGTICTCIYYLLYYSWFQTFAVFCMLYAFFWVIPQCLSFICRRFGTLCLFHLHRQVGMKNSCETSAYKIQTPGCFVLFVLRFCIVSFMYIYSYLFCLYWCKDGPLPPSENSIVVSQ